MEFGIFFRKKMLSKIQKVYRSALECKMIIPIETVREIVHDSKNKLRFLIKMPKNNAKVLKTSNLEKEIHAKQNQQQNKDSPKKDHRIVVDLFRPYETKLLIETFQIHSSKEYAILLNKFPVLQNHLLIVPTVFEPQTQNLNIQDFEAALYTLQSIHQCHSQEAKEWLLFYNRGLFSGASQPHKHLQAVPQYLNGEYEFPIVESFKQQALDHTSSEDTIFPFDELKQVKHGVLCIAPLMQQYLSQQIDVHTAAEKLFSKYYTLLEKLDLLSEQSLSKEKAEYLTVICNMDEQTEEKHLLSLDIHQYPSYNLLFTQEWMLIIPRKLENYQGISMNSLGFLFSYFCKTEHDQDVLLNQIGCLNLMKALCFENSQ